MSFDIVLNRILSPDERLEFGGKRLGPGFVPGHRVRMAGPWDDQTCDECWPFFGLVWDIDDPLQPNPPLHRRDRHWMELVMDLFDEEIFVSEGPKDPFGGAEAPFEDAILSLGPQAVENAFGKTRSLWILGGLIAVREIYADDGTLVPIPEKERRLRRALEEKYDKKRANWLLLGMITVEELLDDDGKLRPVKELEEELESE